MKNILSTLLLLLALSASAQMPRQPETAWISIADSLYALPSAVTQTEVKPGWKIADVAETKSKTKRYIWGAHAKQLADSEQPKLVLKVSNGTLHDIILIRLKEKKEYRLMPKVNPMECEPIFIDLTTFNIQLLSDERYLISPLQPLQKGEYIIIDTSAKAVNEMGDMRVHEFTVR